MLWKRTICLNFNFKFKLSIKFLPFLKFKSDHGFKISHQEKRRMLSDVCLVLTLLFFKALQFCFFQSEDSWGQESKNEGENVNQVFYFILIFTQQRLITFLFCLSHAICPSARLNVGCPVGFISEFLRELSEDFSTVHQFLL